MRYDKSIKHRYRYGALGNQTYSAIAVYHRNGHRRELRVNMAWLVCTRYRMIAKGKRKVGFGLIESTW